jgi:RNA 3'-terminal phosphate cyclase (ATP)
MKINSEQTSEGGGQVCRIAATLSAILHETITLKNIRSGRDKPGLKKQHCSCLNAVEQMCKATITGNTVGSQEVHISNIALLTESGTEYELDACQGSLTLLLQVLVPMALFCKEPVTFTCHGSTHTSNSPSWEFFQHVLLPTLAKHFGIKVDIKTTDFCFSQFNGGGMSTGKVVLTVHPQSTIPPIVLTDRGELTNVHMYATLYGKACSKSDNLTQTFLQLPHAEDVSITTINSPKGFGISVTLVAETTTGCLISGSDMWDSKNRKKTASQIIETAYEHLSRNIETQNCVDEWLQDQLLVYMALVDKPTSSHVISGVLTEHSTSALYVIERMTGVSLSDSLT